MSGFKVLQPFSSGTHGLGPEPGFAVSGGRARRRFAVASAGCGLGQAAARQAWDSLPRLVPMSYSLRAGEAARGSLESWGEALTWNSPFCRGNPGLLPEASGVVHPTTPQQRCQVKHLPSV